MEANEKAGTDLKGEDIVMLLSRKALQRILGALWLIDGLLQLQPRMYTMDMVNGVMEPMLQSQPGPISANLHWIVNETILHLTAVNLLISFVQICLGLGFLFLSTRWVKESRQGPGKRQARSAALLKISLRSWL